MGKLHGLFYGITCNTQAGSGHYRIYVVYTGWNSFDLTLSHHTNTCADVDDYIRVRFVCVLSRVCCCMSVSHFCVMLCVHLRVGRSTGNVDSVNN